MTEAIPLKVLIEAWGKLKAIQANTAVPLGVRCDVSDLCGTLGYYIKSAAQDVQVPVAGEVEA